MIAKSDNVASDVELPKKERADGKLLLQANSAGGARSAVCPQRYRPDPIGGRGVRKMLGIPHGGSVVQNSPGKTSEIIPAQGSVAPTITSVLVCRPHQAVVLVWSRSAHIVD